jgi:hypothetical protein
MKGGSVGLIATNLPILYITSLNTLLFASKGDISLNDIPFTGKSGTSVM